MNSGIRTAAAALFVIAAGSGLAACGEAAVDVAPAASVRDELKPQEHQGHKDLAASKEQDGVPVKPFEHLLRGGSS